MNFVSFIVVFLLAWWITLFAVLPWGVKRDMEPETGNEPGAPRHPDLKRKFIITTFLAAIITAVICLFVQSEWLSFHDVAMEMASDDNL